jgi:hypothetical protein
MRRNGHERTRSARNNFTSNLFRFVSFRSNGDLNLLHLRMLLEWSLRRCISLLKVTSNLYAIPCASAAGFKPLIFASSSFHPYFWVCRKTDRGVNYWMQLASLNIFDCIKFFFYLMYVCCYSVGVWLDFSASRGRRGIAVQY